MPYRHFPLDIDIGEKGALVIDAEGKNAVLVGKSKTSAKNGTIGCFGNRLEIEAVKWRKHGKFKLDGIRRRDDEGLEMAL